MTLVDFVLLLLVAGIAGSVGQSIAGEVRGGIFATIGIGFIGALIGTWVARTMKLPTMFVLTVGGTPFPVVWAILGSALFVAVIAVLTRRS